MAVPDGYVDPHDAGAIAQVIADTQRLMGVPGVVDLLTRLPGVSHRAGQPKRFRSPAQPAAVVLGAQDELVLAEPPVHVQVVGGVVLHRDPTPPGELPTVLARLIAALTREQASDEQTATVLTAAREAIAGM